MAKPPLRRGLSLGSRITPAVMWILGISTASFLVLLFSTPPARENLVGWLGLTPDSLLHGHIWKLVTTAFVYPANAVFAFLFNALMLWLFIPVLEREWGTRRFVWFAAVTTVVGNLVSALVGLALHSGSLISGLSPFIFASIAGFGTSFAHQPVQFFGVLPMKGRTLALGVLAVLLLQTLLNGDWIPSAGYVAAMAIAWGFAGGRLTPGVWVLRWRRNRLRRKLSVMSGGSPTQNSTQESTQKSTTTGRPPKKQEWLN